MSIVHVASTSRADYRGLRAVAQKLQQAAGLRVEFTLWPGADSPEERQRRCEQAHVDNLSPIQPQQASPVPDVVVILGDQLELLPIAMASLQNNIPIGHIHGGEETTGAIDNQVRHALTKMSHLHFVSHPDYQKRVLQMGEEDWRVHLVGAPSLDDFAIPSTQDRQSIREKFGFKGRYLTVCYQPPTLELDSLEDQVASLEAALSECQLPVAWIGPNSDVGSDLIRKRAQAYSWKASIEVKYFDALNPQDYIDLLYGSEALVGNTSAGIYEAPSLQLPFVNIGARQEGRAQCINVIDTPPDSHAILSAIKYAISKDMKEIAANLDNLFDQGGASSKILAVLQSLPSKEKLLRKKFQDHG